jgi:hypothetical protein
MKRKASLLLAAPVLALGFAGTVSAHRLDVPAAVCSFAELGSPAPAPYFTVNGTGFTAGHTYYAVATAPSGTTQILYQSFQGKFFFQEAAPDAGTYSIAIHKSVDAHAVIASCSASE